MPLAKFVVPGLAALAVVTAAGLSQAQDYPETDLKFGHFAPPTTSHSQVDAWLAEQLKERSGGKVTEEIFWSGAVGSSRELLDLAGQGAVDISAVPPSYFPARLPLIAAPSSLPLALPTPEDAQTVVHTLWQEFPEMQEEAEAANVWPLFFHSLNQYHLLCTSPIRNLEDLKGKRIRSQGEYIPMALDAVGAVPVTILPAEFYESLQRGSVDCMLLPWDLMTAFRLEEVAKYGSTINFGSLISNPQWFNLDVWEGFSPEVRALFTGLVPEVLALDLKMAEESEQAAIEKMQAAGVEIIEFPDQAAFEAAVPDFLDVWVAKMEDAGKGDVAKRMAERWRSLR